MHPATLQHICGMIAMMRQALVSIEAAVNAELNMEAQAKGKTSVFHEPEESQFLDEKSDEILGKLLDMTSGEDDEKGTK